MNTASIRYLNVILTVLTLVLGLNLYVQFGQLPSGVSEAEAAPARGGIPDEGAQRYEIITQLKALNTKVDRTNSILSSGNMKVRVMIPKGKK